MAGNMGGSCPSTNFCNDMINTTVIHILRGVCDNCEIPFEKVPELFFARIANVLLTIQEHLPVYSDKIYHITAQLLKSGYEAARSRNPDMNIQANQIHGNESIAAKITQLYNLDQKMKTLMQEKSSLFQSILSDLNKDQKHNSSFVGAGPSTLESQSRDVSISSESIQEGSKGKSSLGKKRFSRTAISRAVDISDDESNAMKKERMDTEESIEILSTSDTNENCREISLVSRPILNEHSFSKRVAYNIGSSVVCCLKIVKQLCFAGTLDGKVLTFSKTGVLNDVLEAHEGAITSIILWKPRIITTSVDATMCYFDLDKKTIRGVEVGCPVMCSREWKGILYLGTSRGQIVKYNVRAFTRIGAFFQISSSSVRDIEVMDRGICTIMAVASENEPVVIRCAETGSLIWTSKYLLDIHSLSLLTGWPNYLCGLNPKGIRVIRFKDLNEKVVLKSRETCGGHKLVEYSGSLYFGGVDGNIYVYSGKDKKVVQLCGIGEIITALSVDARKVIFSTRRTVTHIPLLNNYKEDTFR